MLANSRWLGMTLNKNIWSRDGALFLPENTVLTEKHLALLDDMGVELKEADVEDAQLTMPRMIERAVDEIKGIFEQAKSSNRVLIRDMAETIVPTIRGLAETFHLHEILTHLQEKDDYTYRHSVAVAILSTLLGKWLGLNERELHTLSVAALLHDIGKVQIPAEILNKPARLTKDEFEIVKRHTVIGFDYIHEIPRFGEEHSVVALQHHERLDGSGYPHQLGEDGIHYYSKIVMVTDVFHAMLSERPYKKAAPFYKVLNEMREGAFGLFDPAVIATFSHKAMESLIGNEVRLSNGQNAIIIKIHPHDVSNPLLYVDRKFIDLSREPSLHIESI